jgi:hypothetical protein
MKPDTDPNEEFKWDMTAVVMTVLLIVLVLALVGAFAPFDHTT